MTPELVVTAILAGVPGLLAAGGLLVRVNRLERDVGECVRRELYEAQHKGLDTQLNEIKADVRLILNNMPRARNAFDDESGSHRIPR